MYSRILVIHPGALGDFLAALPIVAGLRERYPRAWVEVLARGQLASLGDGLANRTGNLDTRPLSGCDHSVGGAGPRRTSSNYIDSFDLVVTWSRDSFSPYVPDGFDGEAVVLPAMPPPGVSASLSFFESVPQLRGLAYRPPQVRITRAEAAQADHVLASNGLAHPITAVHPGSGGRSKCWPVEYFARAISALLENGRHVVLLEGEADAEAVSGVQRAVRGEPVPVLRSLPLRTLAAVLSRCDQYLGNDSGVSHLAAAVGTECVVIFGPTDPAVWAPPGPGVKVLAADVPCRPCRQTSPDCDRLQCMKELAPERVIEAILR